MKLYSKDIELVKWQWSGKDHAVRPGIEIVTVQWHELEGVSLPVDFRIYQKDKDDKTLFRSSSLMNCIEIKKPLIVFIF